MEGDIIDMEDVDVIQEDVDILTEAAEVIKAILEEDITPENLTETESLLDVAWDLSDYLINLRSNLNTDQYTHIAELP